MNTVIYKPFKRKASKWEMDTENILRDGMGRRAISVKIGMQNITDSVTGQVVSATPIYEYIYEDILRNIFSDSEEYAVRVNLGCEPQITITYENRLVMHNDMIAKEVEKINKAVEDTELRDIVEILVNSQLNFNTKAPVSKEYRELIGKLNDKCDAYYPPDFVGLVLRERFFEQDREITGYKEDIHYMSGTELKEELGRAIKENNDEKIKDIKEELMYQFLLGDMLSNPQIKF